MTSPAALAAAARQHLREKFLRARVAVSGANFAVAETGTLVVLESEGNGRMCLTLPEVLVSLVGIEKLVPTFEDLDVFLQLLPRSSTGERMNPYTSMWTGVHPGDGPQEVHVVLLDNGRTNVLADEVGRQALRCIRCSACLNACPVYERTGGHAYGSVYPGPIGAILTPLLRGVGHDAQVDSLPYASSLCGRCYEVCPVQIDIPSVLVHLRAKVVDAHRDGRPEGQDLAMKGAALLFADGQRLGYAVKAGSVANRFVTMVSRRTLPGGRTAIGRIPGPGASAWTGARDLPAPPRESFRSWWAKRTVAATRRDVVTARDDDPGAVRSALRQDPTAAPTALPALLRPCPVVEDVVGLFVERVEDYRAVVVRCTPRRCRRPGREGLADARDGSSSRPGSPTRGCRTASTGSPTTAPHRLRPRRASTPSSPPPRSGSP